MPYVTSFDVKGTKVDIQDAEAKKTLIQSILQFQNCRQKF